MNLSKVDLMFASGVAIEEIDIIKEFIDNVKGTEYEEVITEIFGLSAKEKARKAFKKKTLSRIDDKTDGLKMRPDIMRKNIAALKKVAIGKRKDFTKQAAEMNAVVDKIEKAKKNIDKVKYGQELQDLFDQYAPKVINSSLLQKVRRAFLITAISAAALGAYGSTVGRSLAMADLDVNSPYTKIANRELDRRDAGISADMRDMSERQAKIGTEQKAELTRSINSFYEVFNNIQTSNETIKQHIRDIKSLLNEVNNTIKGPGIAEGIIATLSGRAREFSQLVEGIERENRSLANSGRERIGMIPQEQIDSMISSANGISNVIKSIVSGAHQESRERETTVDNATSRRYQNAAESTGRVERAKELEFKVRDAWNDMTPAQFVDAAINGEFGRWTNNLKLVIQTSLGSKAKIFERYLQGKLAAKPNSSVKTKALKEEVSFKYFGY